MKNQRLWIAFMLSLSSLMVLAKDPKREFYELRIYHLATDAQETRMDTYLKDALLPALHRAGIDKVGTFKPVEPDTADRKLYVLIPYKSLDQFTKLHDVLSRDEVYQTQGKDYIDAPYNNPPYARMETIVLQAFAYAPRLQTPNLETPRSERVYELRSYEGHTEKIYRNKVQMFNEGGEVELFKRLNFNAVFYGEVLAGSRMPNLMYMTTFANKAARDEHWKAFGADPQWKTLSATKEYQNNVSKNQTTFLRPTVYSDY